MDGRISGREELRSGNHGALTRVASAHQKPRSEMISERGFSFFRRMGDEGLEPPTSRM
jgi:hypothetical protein